MTLRSAEFNEGDEISSSLRLTTEKGFGRQRERALFQTQGTVWKQSKKEDPSQRSQYTSKKSKVMNCTKGRDRKEQWAMKPRGFICSLGAMVQFLIFIFLLVSNNFYN